LFAFFWFWGGGGGEGWDWWQKKTGMKKKNWKRVINKWREKEKKRKKKKGFCRYGTPCGWIPKTFVMDGMEK
jgi:hypothetical protein